MKPTKKIQEFQRVIEQLQDSLAKANTKIIRYEQLFKSMNKTIDELVNSVIELHPEIKDRL